ncbi:putative chaperonin Cpn60/TCP-1 family, groEL-like equatorial domain-containing protein [Medicago truncatula]|uniref:Putative chaperonin Cpn60/TCP-1 family, groEL-like equatorial domain-containing protein n=2 Tax=Medicago truncatula TaxID=3880 RepID=A0A396HYE6_MEDTR|nr:putative chaperonin Cpn60/TCP-1 family, groEL-like equatorial domain-containing protein [Medicago truncatula]
MNFGYNAARDCYEDLMKARIMDPTKVVRCCIEHAASVAKTFLTSNAVVIDRMELQQPLQRRKPMTMPRKPMAMPRMPMTNSGLGPIGF